MNNHLFKAFKRSKALVLASAVVLSLYGTACAQQPVESTAPSAPATVQTLAKADLKQVIVSTEEEFFQAIDSNVCIVLKPGVYNLSNWANKRLKTIVADEEHVKVIKQNGASVATWSQQGDSGFINLNGINNMTIKAQNSALPTQIVIEDPHENVMNFYNCQNITLEGLIFGHTVKPGCSGNVLHFGECSDVTLNNLNLYGCGAYAIEASKTNNMNVNRCWIHDCTYGMLTMYGCQNVNFKDSFLTCCKEWTLLDCTGCTVNFEGCYFKYNKGNTFLRSKEGITFKNCTFGEYEKEALAEPAK